MFGSRTGCVKEDNVSDSSKNLTDATNRNEAPKFIRTFEGTSGQDSIARLRRIVKTILSSESHCNAFMTWIEIGNRNGLFVFQNKTVQIQPKKLLLDVPTRSDSTKKMIKRCISMRLVSPCTLFHDLI